MKILFWSLVIVGGFAGLLALRLKHKIKSRALRSAMIVLGAVALFAIGTQELYTLTDAFSTWGKLASINVLVPIGWFLGGCFVLFVLLPHTNRAESNEESMPSRQS